MRKAGTWLLLAGALAAPASAQAAQRDFGAYVDPWHYQQWSRDVGVPPQFVARFEAFSRNQTVHSFLREAEHQGLHRVMVTWEPWKPVPSALGPAEQFKPQPGYTNAEIAAGAQDEYIARFARTLATFKGSVDLRYAHEMNGTWYPWSHDPIAYRRAWRHVVQVVRAAGAGNVRFVWSVNPSVYLPYGTWLRSVRVYWPGKKYVDAVGSTMINFTGSKRYQVASFEPRLRELRRRYRKPVMLPETNTVYRGRVRWLRDFRRMLKRMPWIRSIAWSQLQSRGQQHIERAGRLDWNVQSDPAAAAQIRALVREGRR